MKLLFVTSLLFVSSFGFGQEAPGFKKTASKEVKATSNAPVNHIEAKKVFEKAISSLNKGIKLSMPAKLAFANDKNPITKDEVLAVFASIVSSAEAKFVRNPRPYAFNASRLRKDLNPSYQDLIRKGVITPYGPLTTKANGTLSTKEFADSISFMMIRIVDLCHQPLQKFTPDIMRDGG